MRKKMLSLTSDIMWGLTVIGIAGILSYGMLYMRSFIGSAQNIWNFLILSVLIPLSTPAMVFYEIGLTPTILALVTIICAAIFITLVEFRKRNGTRS